MPGCNLYTSNRMEVLVSLLSSNITQNPLSFFEEEIVIIQNRGMQRWLSMEIARKLGVCLNFRFPFPNAFIQEIFSKVIPDIPERLPLDPEIMVWKIAGLLPELINKPSFNQVRSYFNTHGFSGSTSAIDSEKLQSIKIFQFATKIADQFDHYTIYRPEMLLDWELGHEEHWQAELWRNLTSHSTLHMSKLKKQLIETLAAASDIKSLSKRITIFGISALPPFHISIFVALSKFIDVDFYLLNPSAEYWDDILSEKEIQVFIRKQAKKIKRTNLSASDLHLEQGNPLLASLGRYGRDFLSLLHEYAPEEYSYPVETESKTLLSTIQSKILHFDQNDICTPVNKHDRSIQIHSCHNPMREVEILHDNLLAFFQNNPTLHPSDIVVMTPDIEKYAPYIHAVFGCPEENETKIPYSIADRTGDKTNDFASAFLSLLDIAESRFTVTAILDLLQNNEIRNAFQITDDDFLLLKSWIQNTGIRWGIDQSSRENLNLPSSHENTWDAGIKSLLLGYALPSEGTHSFLNIAGFDHLEGSDGEILGKLLDFFTTLVDFTKKCERNFSLQEWSEILIQFFDRFFRNSPGDKQESIAIRSLLITMADLQKESSFNDLIPLDVIKLFLRSKISTLLSKPGFITGAVTFCAMLPMRSVPFKIVCILGLNNDTYPRKSTNHSWDLITANPQKGDRSLELEDRYLFLEALLSAREIVYISYTGQNSNKNSMQYPSVLVEELLDYIDKTVSFESAIEISTEPDQQAFTDTTVTNEKMQSHHETILTVCKSPARKHIITSHFLHAFNQHYYSEKDRFFSFSKSNFESARIIGNPDKTDTLFFTHPLTEPGPEYKNLTIQELCRFYSNPSRYLIHHRLGITVDQYREQLTDDEPFELKGLSEYQIAEEMIERMIDGYTCEEYYDFLKLTNKLPHGSQGKYYYDKVASGVSNFVQRIDGFIHDIKLPDLQIDTMIGDFHISGTLNLIRERSLLHFRYAQLKGSDLLTAWIRHLILNHTKAPQYPVNSSIFTSNKHIIFKEVPQSSMYLSRLLDLYWKGLSQPLQFLPESSWVYAENCIVKLRTDEVALSNALKKWNGDPYSSIPGESSNPYTNLCYRSLTPFGADFTTLSCDIYGSIISHAEGLD